MTGKFAVSRAGHDRGDCYVIVGAEGDFVQLCDGRHRTLTNLKRKRLKHVQVMDCGVSPELMSRLENGEAVRDEEIKYEIRQYLRTI